MNTSTLLKRLVTERRDALNKPKYIPIRKLPPAAQRAVRNYAALRRAKEAAALICKEFGFDPRTCQFTDGGYVLNVQEAYTKRQALHLELTKAQQDATIGMLKATTGPARAAVIEKFIADTRHLL